MTKLALEQAESYSDKWDPSQRDCAGFVRFLFRESHFSNAAIWEGKSGSGLPYVQADELIAYNFQKLESANYETGDILVFNRPGQKVEDSWHLMLIVKSPHEFQKRPLVVYHNGDRGKLAEVRKVWLEDLTTSPYSEWRPQRDNPNFYGVYRWKPWL